MGLIGLLITVLLSVLGVGYFFFGGSSDTPLTVINTLPPPAIEEGLSRYEEVRDQALDAKDLVEQNVTEAMDSADVPAKAETPETEKVPVPEKESSAINITNRLMSGGFSVPVKSRAIDTIVLHSSYDLDGADPYSVSGIIKEYEGYGVSAHYLIDRQGGIYRLVEDKNVAYHAGVSKMPDGRRNVNDFSIGIELMNTKTGEFTAAEYAAVNALISHLKKQHPIKSVVGHSDIAPERKTDPWNFDWKKIR